MGFWLAGLYDVSMEVEIQIFEDFDLWDRLAMYGHIDNTFLQQILGFAYIDPEPIFLAAEIHWGKNTLENGDIRSKNGKVISV